MKLKPVIIYLGAFVLVVVLIFLFSGKENEGMDKSVNPHEGIAMDNPHANLPGAQGEAPSKANVSEKYKQRVAELRNKIKENPDDTLSMKELGNFQYMAHQTDESLELYNKILTYDPHRTDILFSIGVIYYNKGDYDQAEEMVKKVLAYDQGNSVALFNLGTIMNAKGDRDGALKYWKQLINDHPNTQEAFLAQTAIKKMDDGNK